MKYNASKIGQNLSRYFLILQFFGVHGRQVTPSNVHHLYFSSNLNCMCQNKWKWPNEFVLSLSKKPTLARKLELGTFYISADFD